MRWVIVPFLRAGARAEALAGRMRAAWPELFVTGGGPDPSRHDLVVDAALGMRPGDARSPSTSAARPRHA